MQRARGTASERVLAPSHASSCSAPAKQHHCHFHGGCGDSRAGWHTALHPGAALPAATEGCSGKQEINTRDKRCPEISLPRGRAALQPTLQSFSKQQWQTAVNSSGWQEAELSTPPDRAPLPPPPLASHIPHTIPGELGGDRRAEPELTATAQRHLFV